MSDQDPQQCNPLDGTLLCTKTCGGVFLVLKGTSIERIFISIQNLDPTLVSVQLYNVVKQTHLI